jgi:glucose/arabinose dehydrogenase
MKKLRESFDHHQQQQQQQQLQQQQQQQQHCEAVETFRPSQCAEQVARDVQDEAAPEALQHPADLHSILQQLAEARARADAFEVRVVPRASCMQTAATRQLRALLLRVLCSVTAASLTLARSVHWQSPQQRARCSSCRCNATLRVLQHQMTMYIQSFECSRCGCIEQIAVFCPSIKLQASVPARLSCDCRYCAAAR